MNPQSTLVVAVPAAEPAVWAARRRFDPTSRTGMPAHVTVLYPFAEPAGIGPELFGTLLELFAAHPPFGFALAGVGWFGDRVAFLGPEPAGPFEALTVAVAERFPAFPPYRGTYERVVPHLTIGARARPRALRRAAARVEAQLPIEAVATEVQLMVCGPGRRPWRVVQSFPLGGAVPGGAPPAG
ncbi:MAG TPA: 2'-5' RNA ligase family protein [Acidimicrobiales bacterium]|nr:2'-5' RNA ligase family protein [Acidimicrobiales bacterium]